MSFYQLNNILFGLHMITLISYIVVIYFMKKKNNILKSPNDSLLISIRHIGIYLFTIILVPFELYYLIDFIQSKKEISYMYITSIQQILYSILIFLYINKKDKDKL